MDLLVSLIGNAAVDPNFRKRFLDNPVDIADRYRFQLTKGEFEIMQTIFGDLTPAEKNQLDEVFSVLEEKLYAKLDRCTHPCKMSIYPPPEFRSDLAKAA
jgi:hypothetical protein